MSIDTLGDLIGYQTAADLNPAQRTIVLQAANENPTGLAELVHRLQTNPNVRSVVAVLLREIGKGSHNPQPRAASAGAARSSDLVDQAERLYHARIAKYGAAREPGQPVGNPDYPNIGNTLDAIEYAVDYTLNVNSSMDAIDLEHALRQRINQPWTLEETPARYLPPAEAAELRNKAQAMLELVRSGRLFPEMP